MCLVVQGCTVMSSGHNIRRVNVQKERHDIVQMLENIQTVPLQPGVNVEAQNSTSRAGAHYSDAVIAARMLQYCLTVNTCRMY
jgi:hypothetical protein